MPDLLSPIVLQGLGLVAAATLVLCGRAPGARRAGDGSAREIGGAVRSRTGS